VISDEGRQMAFIGPANRGGPEVPTGLSTVSSVAVQPSDLTLGATIESSEASAPGATPDTQTAFKGGMALDDPHKPKTVDSVLKSNG
jgi:hypothetical protein